MTLEDPSRFFNAYYYTHGCGRLYRRDPEWMEFFSAAANRIVSDIAPRTVLDAGCAFGMLVETLRLRGVEAWGIDISPYAIAQVHPDYRQYCWVASVVDPFPQKYDLIVCIEVLEHLPKPESEQALVNLCNHADNVLFSSSPVDYREATHFNAQPIEYWAEQFARQGFYRDVDFDGSIITPWTTRFQRRSDPLHRIVREYERKYWWLWKESTDLRAVTIEEQETLAEAGEAVQLAAEKVAEKEAQIQALQDEIADKDQAIETLWEGHAEKDQTILTMHGDLTKREQKIQELQDEIADKDTSIEVLWAGVAEKDQAIQYYRDQAQSLTGQVKYWEAMWDDLQRGTLWRLMQRMRAVRMALAPPESWRGRQISRGMQAIRFWMAHGARQTFSQAFARLRRAGAAAASVPANAALLPLDPRSYAAWLPSHEPDAGELTRQRDAAADFDDQPLISFITPVFNPPVHVLRAAVESVRAQTCPHWELCLVDGASSQPEVRLTLAEFARADERIRVEYLKENRGISGNSNVALGMARGEFVAILDHDDVLAPNMLYEVRQCLNAHPETDLVYFDEDKLSEDGRIRREPFFKPDWSPEMLLSVNYLTHSVMRRSLVEAVGGFDPATDGAQDWDLALRVTSQTERVVHIPKVLYHWRQVSGSTAAQLGAKSWAFQTQLRSVESHLPRVGIQHGRALYPSLGYLRVVWPTSGAKVSIVIPTRDRLELLRPCIESLLQRTAYPNFEIILVDNQSTAPQTLAYYETLKQESRIQIVPYPGDFNYSIANNLGASHASGDLLLFLNNDTEVIHSDWLEELARWAERPEVGVVGAKLLYPDGTIQHAGVVLGIRGHADHVFKGVPEKYSGVFGSVEWYRNYLALTAACMMMRREVFAQVGGFDEGYILAFGDVDLCLRVFESGYRNVYTPHARLIHHEGKSRIGGVPAKDILKACQTMRARIAAADPYFNPNLSHAVHIPALSRPEEENPAERIQRIFEEVSAVDPGTIYELY